MPDYQTLPQLYKKNTTGGIQFWNIGFGDCQRNGIAHVIEGSAYIETIHGLLETSSPQITRDTISAGKNAGKTNETTPLQQVAFEAQAKWEKKLKGGYVQSLEEARAGKTDALIEGGILPMLAHTFEKQGHKIKFPCYAQKKYDGIRCIAIKEGGKVTLWSRSRKPITSCPHIEGEIEALLPDGIYDGELYNHEFKTNFEHIVHLVRQETPCEGYKDVQYHIYDCVMGRPFKIRMVALHAAWARIPHVCYLRFAETILISTEAEVPEYYAKFMAEGYEGLMLRNADGPYVHKRSYDLIKLKEMQDAEFPIVGIEEGRGKLQGHAIFVCQAAGMVGTFSVKMAGDTARLREYFNDHSLWEGKKLTVAYQNLTNYGIPRFPVGKAIRDYE